MNQNKDNLVKDAIEPLKSEAPLIIYIDLKSPYAYLSIEPTRNMLKELGIVADWRPFVLDIPSYLGSAKLGKGGKKVTKQNRTQEQWSDVKYAYFDCRRYANLSDKTIRGTVKIWNTDLPAIGLLWLKNFANLMEQCAENSCLERYIDKIYDSFWKREFDAEDIAAILALLEHCLKNRFPAVGICRGLQLLQTYFGGMLHRCSAHEHVATHHSIRFSDSVEIPELKGVEHTVNSFHNFGIRSEYLDPRIEPIAFTQDGWIEAASVIVAPITAIMWHPERNTPVDAIDQKIIRNAFGLNAASAWFPAPKIRMPF